MLANRLTLPTAVLGLELLAGTAAQAQIPPAEAMQSAELEGQRIAEYHYAVEHATNSLMKARPEQHRISLYVAREEEDGWHVYFGAVNVAIAEFSVAYEAVQAQPDDSVFVVDRFKESREIDPELSAAAMALIRSLDAFEPQWARYETYVWRDAAGRWVTYFLPGQTSSGRWPIGGDMRVVVDGDADEVLSATTFHEELVVVEPSFEAAVATHHRHLAGEAPAPTDFAYVLISPQLAPMLLVSGAFRCQVNREGHLVECEAGKN